MMRDVRERFKQIRMIGEGLRVITRSRIAVTMLWGTVVVTTPDGGPSNVRLVTITNVRGDGSLSIMCRMESV